ncbi:MAG TPA: hypothetical protein VF169_10930 [Albitalea sp.]|uniref:hypothetical protein n=1 Tax=Piscinibacter sp. TaxID=1903157 RepID=UPI002ECFF916
MMTDSIDLRPFDPNSTTPTSSSNSPDAELTRYSEAEEGLPAVVRRYSSKDIEVSGIDGRNADRVELDARIRAKQEEFRSQAASPVDPELALSLLKRLALHASLPASQKAGNLELARKEFFSALQLDVPAIEKASTEAGRWLNMHYIPTDLLGVAPLALLSVLGKTSLSATDSAWIYMFSQVAVQAVTPYLGARLMVPMLEIQRQVRMGVSVRYGATSQLGTAIAGVYKEASTLNSLLKQPDMDASVIERQMQRLEAQFTSYDDNASVNKVRYTVYGAENLTRMVRATILVTGLWASFLAQRSDPKQSLIPYALIVQIASVLAAWVMHWTWAGPKRDQLLRDDQLKADLKKFGPQIADSLVERQQALHSKVELTVDQLDGLDDAATNELRQMWKTRMVTKVAMAKSLFVGEQRKLVGRTAASLGVSIGMISKWVDLRAMLREAAPPELTRGEQEMLDGLRGKLPSWQRDQHISADDKHRETLLHLTHDEEMVFQSLEAKEGAAHDWNEAKLELSTIDAAIAQKRDALDETKASAMAELEHELRLIADDLMALKGGSWMDIREDRKRLLDGVLTDTPSSNTFSMFSQYLFGCLVSNKSDLVKTAEMLAGNVQSEFHEGAAFTLLKYSKAFQMVFGGSATALGVAAANKLCDAYDVELSMSWRIASSIVPLGFVYAAEITGGIPVNQVFSDRAEWRMKYAHQPPCTAEKFAMCMTSFLKGILSAPMEAGRLATGAVTVPYARSVLERARERVESGR